MTRLTVALATVLSLAFTPVAAQDFQKGMDALQSGDPSVAIRELLPLAKQGFGPAQAILGSMFEYGLGITKDYDEALKWYTFAAAQGEAAAQTNLGLMYYTGQGVSQDYNMAALWFGAAAAQGVAKAQANLGIMYYNGQAFLQDDIMAHVWSNIAAASGDENAMKLLKITTDRMRSADISKAQAMARECMNSGYEKCGY